MLISHHGESPTDRGAVLYVDRVSTAGDPGRGRPRPHVALRVVLHARHRAVPRRLPAVAGRGRFGAVYERETMIPPGGGRRRAPHHLHVRRPDEVPRAGYPGGVAHAYKVMQAGPTLLEPDGLVERGKSRFETCFGGPGARDTSRWCFARATGDRYAVDRRWPVRNGAPPWSATSSGSTPGRAVDPRRSGRGRDRRVHRAVPKGGAYRDEDRPPRRTQAGDGRTLAVRAPQSRSTTWPELDARGAESETTICPIRLSFLIYQSHRHRSCERR